MELRDDHYCFVCGTRNKSGLHLEFRLNNDEDMMSTEFTPQKRHQGFKDIVHGGLIGLILDEIMVNLAWKKGYPAVSAEFTVRLRKMARIGEKISFKSWIEREQKKMVYTCSEARNVTGDVIATAVAKCYKLGKVK